MQMTYGTLLRCRARESFTAFLSASLSLARDDSLGNKCRFSEKHPFPYYWRINLPPLLQSREMRNPTASTHNNILELANRVLRQLLFFG